MNRNTEEIRQQIERLQKMPDTPSRRAKIKGLQKALEAIPILQNTKKSYTRKKASYSKTDLRHEIATKKITRDGSTKLMSREEMNEFLNLS